MNSFITTLSGFLVIYAVVVTTVYCVEIKGTGLTKKEIIALTRDHFGRPDPDGLLNGFFPVWAVIQFCLSGFFLVIALISGVCYLLGFRTPPEERQVK
ncbi:unnamed protein product [Rotaria sp. Silwood1]|nr:unnamed protein product [Rotaria sp. Silwood1]CAF3345879.1 unnamed protein product [Rotaria sp. Silwood1]CAF4980103.1 unnamed protein product [Rotaria sp. Silwood1]